MTGAFVPVVSRIDARDAVADQDVALRRPEIAARGGIAQMLSGHTVRFEPEGEAKRLEQPTHCVVIDVMLSDGEVGLGQGGLRPLELDVRRLVMRQMGRRIKQVGRGKRDLVLVDERRVLRRRRNRPAMSASWPCVDLDQPFSSLCQIGHHCTPDELQLGGAQGDGDHVAGQQSGGDPAGRHVPHRRVPRVKTLDLGATGLLHRGLEAFVAGQVITDQGREDQQAVLRVCLDDDVALLPHGVHVMVGAVSDQKDQRLPAQALLPVGQSESRGMELLCQPVQLDQRVLTHHPDRIRPPMVEGFCGVLEVSRVGQAG